MSEVTKLYENAGINAISQKTKDCNYCYYYEETYNAPCHVCTADKCPFEKNIIPPFTAEKQLELIKFLMEQNDFSWTITQQGKVTEYAFYVGYEHGSGDFKEFAEALAGIINNLWQGFTMEERRQVKEILK